jgi:hypothetical protein
LVEWAVPDFRLPVDLHFVPNDPLYPLQWHLANADHQDIAVEAAWDLTRGDPAVVVAVIGFNLLGQGLQDVLDPPALRVQAGEHAANGRYHDALNIYRRLLEAEGLESEKTELARLIADTARAIRAVKAAGGQPEGMEALSHRSVAAAVARRRRLTRWLVAGVLFLAFLFPEARLLIAPVMIVLLAIVEIPFLFCLLIRGARNPA